MNKGASNIELLPLDLVPKSEIAKWQNDVQVKYQLIGYRMPIHEKSVEKWVDSIGQETGATRAVYGVFLDQKAIGLAWLCNIDYVNSWCNAGAFISDLNFRNKGYGKSIFYILADFAFNGLGLRKVELEVISNNYAAIKLYKQIGFSLDGSRRDHFFKNGKFIDVNIMSLLSSEFHLDEAFDINRLT